NFGDYTDGYSPENTISNPGELLPGCSVADDFTAPLGDPSESRLAAALVFRESPNTCPVPSARPAPGALMTEKNLAAVDGVVLKNPWLTNRIVR
ncbi:MAG: peptidase, partial [Gammaproteobacteria bacterium]|nr:peptidase [Gammaproteobacteria bacterium]